jgi:hypothetical protein
MNSVNGVFVAMRAAMALLFLVGWIRIELNQ